VFWRRTVPVVITFTVGLSLILARFIPKSPFPGIDENFSVYFDIIAVFAFILGAGNLLKVHLTKINRKARDWPYSIITLVGFFFTLVVGLAKVGGPPGLQGDTLAEGSLFRFCYDAMFNPLGATMFALLAFFVASAAYRAFRAKTVEATILLVAAFIILLGRTFVGHYLTAWVLLLPPAFHFLYIPNLAGWIMSWPNTAGQRAIMIGIALGIISTSLRLILGIERGYLGGKK
jgi:hypothetical protein